MRKGKGMVSCGEMLFMILLFPFMILYYLLKAMK